MASPNENETNPYRAPSTGWSGTDLPDQSRIDPELVKKFREQILALGVLWIIIGSVSAVLAGLALQGNRELSNALGGDIQFLLIFIAALGLTWLVLGVLSCMKHMWAVYVGLVLSYVSLLGNLLNLNLCSMVIVILVILQSHRVIGWANRLQAAGVPLSAKP